jgi:hypothetical protein
MEFIFFCQFSGDSDPLPAGFVDLRQSALLKFKHLRELSGAETAHLAAGIDRKNTFGNINSAERTRFDHISSIQLCCFSVMNNDFSHPVTSPHQEICSVQESQQVKLPVWNFPLPSAPGTHCVQGERS